MYEVPALGVKPRWASWRRFLTWVVVNTGVWILLVPLVAVALESIPPVEHPISVPLLIGVFAGLGNGLPQWLLLRGRVSAWWIMGTMVAWAGGAVVLEAAEDVIRLTPVIEGVTLGAVLGAIQWVLLRDRFSNAFVWAVASIVGWTAASVLNDRMLGSGFVIALVPAVVSGAALVWGMRPLHRAERSLVLE